MMAHNPNKDHDDNAARLRELVAVFGSDITIGLATDEFRTGPGRSAKTITRNLREAARDERLDQVRADNRTAAGLDSERRAYERVMDNYERGVESSTRDELAANRYARRQNLLPRKSSATRLIEHANRQRRNG